MPEENEGHPAWQEILDVLPNDFHSLITPQLKKWDEGVNAKLSEVRSQYDPYKDFVENNVDPQLLQQAVALVNAISTDPESVAKDLIEEFELGFVPKTELEKIQQGIKPDESDDLFGETQFDITKHPAFLEVKNALDQVTGKLSKQEESEQQEQARKAHEAALEALKKDPETGEDRNFDPMFVTALMSQGASGEEAVKQYQGIVNQAAAQIAGSSKQVPQPPVVMGGEGTTGSGIPDTSTSMGSMKKNDVNALVAEMIAKAQSQD